MRVTAHPPPDLSEERGPRGRIPTYVFLSYACTSTVCRSPWTRILVPLSAMLPPGQVRASPPGWRRPQRIASVTSCSGLPSTRGKRNRPRSATRSSMRPLGCSASLDSLGAALPVGARPGCRRTGRRRPARPERRCTTPRCPAREDAGPDKRCSGRSGVERRITPGELGPCTCRCRCGVARRQHGKGGWRGLGPQQHGRRGRRSPRIHRAVGRYRVDERFRRHHESPQRSKDRRHGTAGLSTHPRLGAPVVGAGMDLGRRAAT